MEGGKQTNTSVRSWSNTRPRVLLSIVIFSRASECEVIEWMSHLSQRFMGHQYPSFHSERGETQSCKFRMTLPFRQFCCAGLGKECGRFSSWQGKARQPQGSVSGVTIRLHTNHIQWPGWQQVALVVTALSRLKL